MTLTDAVAASAQAIGFDFISNAQFSPTFVPIIINKPFCILVILLAALIDYFIPQYYTYIASLIKTTREGRARFRSLHKRYYTLALRIKPLLGLQNHFAFCSLAKRQLNIIFKEMEGFHVSYWRLYNWNDLTLRQIYSFIDETDDVN
eukprot:UN03563